MKSKTIEKRFEMIRTAVAIAIALGIALVVIVLVSEDPANALYNFLIGPLTSFWPSLSPFVGWQWALCFRQTKRTWPPKAGSTCPVQLHRWRLFCWICRLSSIRSYVFW